METQNAEVVELSLEKVIETKLVQSNVTEQVLVALKDKYGGMKLKAIDDKESYLEIKAAAKECGKVRTLAVKICKEGREEAVKTQKLWIAKEKEVVGKVAEVEDALDAEILRFDKEVERLENEEKERQEAAYINRQAMLTKMGATYVDGSFVLGGASFEAALIKGSEEDIWTETVLPKFQAEYEKIEAVRVEEERQKAEREAEMKRQQEELEQKQIELKKQQEEFEKQKQEAEKAETERVKELVKNRSAVLRGIGMSYDGSQYDFVDIYIHNNQMATMPENEWTELVLKTTEVIKKWKDAEEKRKQEEQLEQQRINEEKNKAAIELAKQEAVRIEQQRVAEEEAKRQSELEAATDKTKWAEFLKDVGNISFFDMKSPQYKTKMNAARGKINEILGL